MRRGLKMQDVQAAYDNLLACDDGVKISPGNEKLSKIPNISLMPVDTCPGMVDECRFCYGRSLLKVYAQTKVRWMVNTYYACNDLDRFIRDVAAQIYLSRAKYFRVHVAGDFFKQEYIDAWYDICERSTDVQFLAFTKSFMFDYSSKPENLAIIWSVFPSTDERMIPPGPRAYADFSCIDREYAQPEQCLQDGMADDRNNYYRYKMAMKCTGTCEACGFCFNIDRNSTRLSLSGGPKFMDVGFHAHGRAVQSEIVKLKAAKKRGGEKIE